MYCIIRNVHSNPQVAQARSPRRRKPPLGKTHPQIKVGSLRKIINRFQNRSGADQVRQRDMILVKLMPSRDDLLKWALFKYDDRSIVFWSPSPAERSAATKAYTLIKSFAPRVKRKSEASDGEEEEGSDGRYTLLYALCNIVHFYTTCSEEYLLFLKPRRSLSQTKICISQKVL